jgi:hypothetical protein
MRVLAGPCILIAGVSMIGAYRRPPAPTSAERQVLDSAPLPYVVSVIGWDEQTALRLGKDSDAYAQRLARLLRDSRAFRSVRLEPKPGRESDLIATPTGAYCNSGVLPLWTFISAGIVPTVFDEEECDGMELRWVKSGRPTTVEVGFRFQSRAVMGLAAVPLGFAPGWAHGSITADSRFQQRVRLEILRHREEISQLAQP